MSIKSYIYIILYNTGSQLVRKTRVWGVYTTTKLGDTSPVGAVLWSFGEESLHNPVFHSALHSSLSARQLHSTTVFPLPCCSHHLRISSCGHPHHAVVPLMQHAHIHCTHSFSPHAWGVYLYLHYCLFLLITNAFLWCIYFTQWGETDGCVPTRCWIWTLVCSKDCWSQWWLQVGTTCPVSWLLQQNVLGHTQFLHEVCLYTFGAFFVQFCRIGVGQVVSLSSCVHTHTHTHTHTHKK